MVLSQSETATKTSTAISVAILVLFQMFPMVFYCVVKVNKKHLEHPVVKNKVGSMYLGLDAKNPYVDTYAPIFLLRRSSALSLAR